MRRANPAADRAAQNQQTIKSLLKLEGNKICADCKRNKHPRWASWNLGVFVCIRCSGIHRGMGTHISRVKSVDLDAWTDEQLQSILKWGNSRANKYWEAKLAPGHVPPEAKIENFIRTKYDSKRWVMDGPMPDPATLDADGDDDVPLNIVQEKAKIERANSQRVSSAPQSAQPQRKAPAPTIDLFGDDAPVTPPVRPSTTDNPSRPQVNPVSQPPRQNKPGDSLLGLDFFGNSQPSNGRPSSATSNPLASTAPSRPDLKQSILSLYASAPKSQQQAQTQPQTSPHNRQPSFGGMASPPPQSPPPAQPDAFGGLTNAFSGLSFPSTTSPPPPPKQQSAFSDLSKFTPSIPTKSAPSAPKVTSPPPLSGGTFFESRPPAPSTQPKSPPAPARAPSNGLDFAFTQSPPPPPKVPSPAKPPPNDLFGDFEDFSSPAPASNPAPVPTAPPSSKVSSPPADNITSAFNLSTPSAPSSKPAAQKPPLVAQNSSAMFDPWASANDNAWSAEAAPNPPPKPRAPSIGRPPAHITPSDFGGGWGSSASKAPESAPKVTADEDFGGWTSASTTQNTTSGNQASKSSGGFGGNDDLFSNVWE